MKSYNKLNTVCRPVVLKLEPAAESPGGLVKTQIAELHPESFQISRSGIRPRI